MKKDFSEIILKIIAYAVTVFFALVILVPLVFMVSNSLKDNKKVSDPKLSIIPSVSRSMAIIADYSELTDKDEKEIKDILLKDSILAMFSTMYEIDNDSIYEVEFYAETKGKTIFYSKAHRMRIQSLLDYDYFNRATVSKDLLLSDDNYIKLSDKIGYEFDINGIKRNFNKTDIGKNYLNNTIENILKNKYALKGRCEGSILSDNPLLMFENYIYYYQLPTQLYKNNPSIKNFSYFIFLFNTVVTIFFGILAQIILCSSSAFALSRLFEKRLSRSLLLFFLGVGMVPFITIMIPQFMLFKDLGMYNNYAALLVPWLIPNGFSVYLFKGFFDRLPGGLFDAMKIDGAKEWYMYTRLCMPLSKPIITIIALSTFIGGWNSFFWEWMVVEKQNLWTMNVALYNLSRIDQIKDNFLMGIAFVMILPILIMTFMFSEQIKQSIAASGIKG